MKTIISAVLKNRRLIPTISHKVLNMTHFVMNRYKIIHIYFSTHANPSKRR